VSAPSDRKLAMVTIDLSGTPDHRGLAAELFDRVWELLEQPGRTVREDDELIHAAHASRHHWGQHDPTDHARLATGEWQISRVYAILGRGEPARWHAERSLAHCVEGRVDGVLRGAAYEALARATRLVGDHAAVHRYLRLGREVAASMDDPDDRAMLLADLDEVEPGALTTH
jgi:hypothetical protein